MAMLTQLESTNQGTSILTEGSSSVQKKNTVGKEPGSPESYGKHGVHFPAGPVQQSRTAH